MAIGMASDKMTGCAPALQDCRSVWIVHALADREQEGACPPQVLQKTLFRFGAPILGDHLPPDIIEGDGNARPGLREQGSCAQNQCLASSDSLQCSDRITAAGTRAVLLVTRSAFHPRDRPQSPGWIASVSPTSAPALFRPHRKPRCRWESRPPPARRPVDLLPDAVRPLTPLLASSQSENPTRLRDRWRPRWGDRYKHSPAAEGSAPAQPCSYSCIRSSPGCWCTASAHWDSVCIWNARSRLPV